MDFAYCIDCKELSYAITDYGYIIVNHVKSGLFGWGKDSIAPL